MRSTALKLKPYLLLLVVLIVAYMPLSTFYFGMKNDAFSDNFPNKYFFTAALHSGHLPLWNPYLNFGFPVYADPGFAFWSPITWLIGSTIGYTAYTLTAEVLLYIYLAGVCMFRLGRFLQFKVSTSVTIACMYMCSGFFVGCLQYINFLTSAAFLPLLMLCFLKLQQKVSYRHAFWCGCAYYLILCGGHPAIPIATAYFVATYFLLLLLFQHKLLAPVKQLLLYNTLAIFIAAILFSPAIYSYLTVWPFYARHSAAEQTLFTSTGFTISSYISYVFPFSTIAKDFFTNDVAMRNGYFSLAGFTLVIYGLITKNRKAFVYAILAIVMLLLSAGGNFKALLYAHLPALSFIRYNGEFRVFAILSFCIAAGYGLQTLVVTKNYSIRYKKILQLLIAVIAIVLIVCFCLLNDGFFKAVPSGVATIEKAKWILSNIPFSLSLLLSSSLALVVAAGLLWVTKKSPKYLLFVVVADLVINSVLYLPVTGVGQVKLADIQKIYDNNPSGIPKPSLQPIDKIDTLDVKTTGLVGDLTYYNKQVGTTKLTDYPSYFTATDTYFNSDQEKIVSKKPFIFLKSNLGRSTIDKIKIVRFTPTCIEVYANATQADTLVILQNDYAFWSTKLNGTPVNKSTVFYSFIGVPVKEGFNKVVLSYQDDFLLPLVLFAVIFFVCNCVILMQRKSTY